MKGYIQLKRGTDTEELMKHPECFLLLTLIAYRARRTNDGFNPERLDIGQALIGDFKSIGLTSEKVYRTAKKKLQEWNFVAFQGTNKGTVATLLNSNVYDINGDDEGDQNGGQGADEGRPRGDQGATEGRAGGGQGATNKNVKNGNNAKNVKNGKNVKKNGADLFETGKVVAMPWTGENFLRAWDSWKNYKLKNLKFQYKTPESEQAALMDLAEISGGLESNAIKIIQQSMAKGWKGLFALKNGYGNSNNSNGTGEGSGRKPITSASHEDIINAISQSFSEERQPGL
jgi:hypothetical protein